MDLGFFAVALMGILYLAGALAVVVIGACVLPSIIRRRTRPEREAAKLRHPTAARRDKAA